MTVYRFRDADEVLAWSLPRGTYSELGTLHPRKEVFRMLEQVGLCVVDGFVALIGNLNSTFDRKKTWTSPLASKRLTTSIKHLQTHNGLPE